MPTKKFSSAEDVLKGSVAEVDKLRKMGITDYAVITYAVRLQGGHSHESALQALLHGRSLNEEQIEFVRAMLQRVSVPRPSAEAGFAILDARLVSVLDYGCDWEKILFGGLFLVISPLITWTFLEPFAILNVMLFGLLCAVGGLTFVDRNI